MGAVGPSETSVTFTDLYDVTSQEMILFIVTAVRTSDPTPRFEFAMSLVRISTRILTEDFRGIPQSLQADFGKVLDWTATLPSKLFRSRRSSSILVFDTLRGLNVDSVVK
jgi:hypothetical protein